MKKQLLHLSIVCAATFLFAGNTLAQWTPKSALIMFRENGPVVDGTLDDMWANLPAQDINIPFEFGTENEDTVTMIGDAVPTWKGVWDDDYIYILVEVPDNEYYPNTTNSWTYDKPEIYFDVNPTIVEDGTTTPGAMHANSGHYQFAPTRDDVLDANAAARYDFAVEPGATTSYFVEYSFTIDSLLIRDRSDSFNPNSQCFIGFDITVIDRDQTEGCVDAHQRINWSNNAVDTRELPGANPGESWETLDASGELHFCIDPAVKYTYESSNAIFPNITTDIININTEAKSLEIVNNIGQLVKVIENNPEQINVSELPDGIYFVTIKTKEKVLSSRFLKE